MPKLIVEGEEADQGSDELMILQVIRESYAINWKAKARNRNEWKAVVSEVKALFTGL